LYENVICVTVVIRCRCSR